MPRFSKLLASKLLAAALLAVAGVSMLSVAFDAEAQRIGRGASIGRQSGNVMQSRQATRPPAAAATNNAVPRQAATASAASASAAGLGATAARSGVSRWLAPVAGIAAGLGIAGLLSHFGLGGVLLEMVSSLVLIGLVAYAVLFLLRRWRAGAATPGMQAAGAASAPMPRMGLQSSPQSQPQPQPLMPSPAPALAASAPAAPLPEGDWAIPAGFDVAAFLGEAKKQFVQIQKIWDGGDVAQLREYLTDDLVAEIQPQLAQKQTARAQVAGQTHGQTQVVLLNAELLGIEKVQDGGFDGHLASVRFSGMLREDAGEEAFRFEEVWNLYKANKSGWLLAGIQQIPLQYAS